MTPIDLVPPEVVTRRDLRRRIRRWAKRLGVGAVVAILVYAGLSRFASAKEREVHQLTSRYTSLQERLRTAESLLEERDRLARHREAIDLIRGDQSAGTYLETLGEALTDPSYITSLALQLCPYTDPKWWETGKKEGCAPTLRITGHAPGHQEVGQIIRQMTFSDAFETVDLVSVEIPSAWNEGGEVKFEILCALPVRDDEGR